MSVFGGQFSSLRDNEYRANFDSFFDAFLAIFQLLTLENWGDILVLAWRSDVNNFLVGIYLISWIFIGNFIFLNLFLAVLIDGFNEELNGPTDDD